MQVGLLIPQGWKGEYDGWDPADAWTRTTELTQGAEALGFESLWVFDHFHTVPEVKDEITFESFSVVAALAMETSRVRLGHMVICTGFRNPALTAKLASTIDVVSGGRFELGIGAGWKEDGVVAVVVVAAQRELEAALAGGRAVAGAAGAAEAREDRLHVVAEAAVEGLVHFDHGHRRGRRAVAVLRGEGRLSVADGDGDRAFDADDGRIARRVDRAVLERSDGHSAARRFEEQRLARRGAVQREVGGEEGCAILQEQQRGDERQHTRRAP